MLQMSRKRQRVYAAASPKMKAINISYIFLISSQTVQLRDLTKLDHCVCVGAAVVAVTGCHNALAVGN
jgi:hypothetical protein